MERIWVAEAFAGGGDDKKAGKAAPASAADRVKSVPKKSKSLYHGMMYALVWVMVYLAPLHLPWRVELLLAMPPINSILLCSIESWSLHACLVLPSRFRQAD